MQPAAKLLKASVEIKQNRWKHGAGLEKRLEKAAKTLLSSMRMSLTSLDPPVALHSLLPSQAIVSKSVTRKSLNCTLLPAKDKAPEAVTVGLRRNSSWWACY